MKNLTYSQKVSMVEAFAKDLKNKFKEFQRISLNGYYKYVLEYDGKRKMYLQHEADYFLEKIIKFMQDHDVRDIEVKGNSFSFNTFPNKDKFYF